MNNIEKRYCTNYVIFYVTWNFGDYATNTALKKK